jgi:hypothetical protein
MSDAATNLNALRADLFSAISGQIFHADATPAISAPSATDLATLLALANAMAASFAAHVASVVDPTSGVGSHGIDSLHRSEAPAAADLGSARTLLAELEVKLQQHADADGAHFTPQLLSAPYSEMSGSVYEICAHANALAAQLNAHFAASLTSQVSA